MYRELLNSNSSPILELPVKFVSQICHENPQHTTRWHLFSILWYRHYSKFHHHNSHFLIRLLRNWSYVRRKIVPNCLTKWHFYCPQVDQICTEYINQEAYLIYKLFKFIWPNELNRECRHFPKILIWRIKHKITFYLD